MNIEIVITWHENKPAGFWFNDKLVWETEEVITESDLLETKISLPLYEAVKFSGIFINGLTTERLLILYAAIKTETIRLEKLQIENQIKKRSDIVDDILDTPVDNEWDKE